ncbi:MAG: hypothetical protein M0R51_06475 [Clostridia bacterium]|jgi:hypothetical protein|nr:hypothetical protein [Clostridia bacterium]
MEGMEINFDEALLESSANINDKLELLNAKADSKNEEENILVKNKIDNADNIEEGTPDSKIENKTNENIEDSPSFFSVSLGQDLVNRGVLTSFDESEIAKIASEEGEDVAIIKMFEKQTEIINNELKQNYDKGYQEYLELMSVGADKQEITSLQKIENFRNSLNNIDVKGEEEASVEARKDLLRFHYKLLTKFSDEKIEKNIQKMYDDGSDIEEVEAALATLDEYIPSEKNRIKKETEDKANDDKLKQEKIEGAYVKFIEETDEYFKGEKIDKVTKTKIKDILFTPVKLDNGFVTNKLWAKRDTNPAKFDSKIAYLDIIGFFDDKPLDKFEKRAETKSTSALSSFLSENKSRNIFNSISKSFSAESVRSNLIDEINI